MTRELFLRRKWTLRAHGQQVVFVKQSNERSAHVLMKAFLWALYLPRYPDLKIEISIGRRYKPDVVSLGSRREPTFWGEAGHVGHDKLERLVKRYRRTHFAIAKWDTDLDPFQRMVNETLADMRRYAPIDLLRFPEDSASRFINDRGEIKIDHRDLAWIRIQGETEREP